MKNLIIKEKAFLQNISENDDIAAILKEASISQLNALLYCARKVFAGEIPITQEDFNELSKKGWKNKTNNLADLLLDKEKFEQLLLDSNKDKIKLIKKFSNIFQRILRPFFHKQ